VTTGRRKKAVVAPPAVVFDTRVLLRALLGSDPLAQRLRQSWQLGKCRALVDPAGARALMLALACPALGLSATQQHELLADYLPYAEVVPSPVKAGPRGGRLRSFERLALDLALGAPARWLVSDSRALKSCFLRTGSTSTTICKLVGCEDFFAQP
jgi:hypothetical protein